MKNCPGKGGPRVFYFSSWFTLCWLEICTEKLHKVLFPPPPSTVMWGDHQVVPILSNSEVNLHFLARSFLSALEEIILLQQSKINMISSPFSRTRPRIQVRLFAYRESVLLLSNVPELPDFYKRVNCCRSNRGTVRWAVCTYTPISDL